MKPWVEWLLSIAFLMLVVTVIVALVIGFVRWFRPKSTIGGSSLSSAATADDEVETAFEFDLGTPKQSTIWRRRQLKTQNIRKYTGITFLGQMVTVMVRPPSRTVELLATPNDPSGTSTSLASGTATYSRATYSRDRRGDRQCLVLHDPDGAMSTMYEVPGTGLLLALTDGTVVFALPESQTAIPTGTEATTFGYTHFFGTPASTQMGFISTTPDAKQQSFEHQAFRPFSAKPDGSDGLNAPYGAVVLPVTTMELTSVSAQSGHLHIQSSKGKWRLFGNTSAMAVALDQPTPSTIVMLSQRTSSDLPSPAKKRYVALASVASVASPSPLSPLEAGAGGKTRLASESREFAVEVTSMDSSIRVFGSDENLVYEGTLVSVDQSPELYDPADKPTSANKMTDPCYGTYSSRRLSPIKQHLVVQFSDEWCVFALQLPSSFIRGYALFTR